MFFAQSHEENQRIDKRGHHCFGSKYREYGAPSIRMPNKRPSPWAPQGFSYRWFRRILCSSPPSSGCNIRPQDSWRRAQRLFRNLSRRLIQTFPSSIGLVLMKDFRLVQWFHLTHHPLKGVERLDRVAISRRAVPGVFLANRATLPQRGSLTVSSVSLGTRRVATTGFIRLEIIHHHTPSSYTNELLVFYGQSCQHCFRLCYSF